MKRPWLASLLAAVLAAPAVRAQAPRVHLGAGPSYARAAGMLDRYVSEGVGGGAWLVLNPRRVVSVRLDADYLHFAPAVRTFPRSVGSPAVISTGSGMLIACAGPRVRGRVGSLELSAAGGAGFARLTTTGSASVGPYPGLNRSTSFDDLTYAATAGGAVAVALGHQPSRLWLDLSARYLWIGPARWLREGNLPAGTISGVYLNPTWSTAALWVFRLSVGVGLQR